MTLFAYTPASCLFAMTATTGVSLVFERPSRSQNTIGEIALSYASALTVICDLQPTSGGFLRMLGGQIPAPNYFGLIQGYAALQHGDRTSIYSALLEVANVGHYGSAQTEILLRVVR